MGLPRTAPWHLLGRGAVPTGFSWRPPSLLVPAFSALSPDLLIIPGKGMLELPFAAALGIAPE